MHETIVGYCGKAKAGTGLILRGETALYSLRSNPQGGAPSEGTPWDQKRHASCAAPVVNMAVKPFVTKHETHRSNGRGLLSDT